MKLESPRSLFIVALPRSLSSMIYHAARGCLGLDEPHWTSDGEFLNADRFVLVPGPNDSLSVKFTTETSERALFTKISEFLDHVVVPHGFAYKDVIQPFVVAKWLKQNRPPTLKMKRNVADVAYSMLEHRWHYPGRLFPKVAPVELAVVRGLLSAQEELDSIPGIDVNFDALIQDETVLYSALTALYGEDSLLQQTRYIDRNFRSQRDKIIERRSSARYAQVLDYIEQAKRPSRWWQF